MANEFEHKLVDVLGYRLPFELTRYLDDVLQTPTPLDVLDLGCGTGLCGQAIKPWAHRLHGVDVSPRMMELARARDVYDMLHEMELVEFLARCQDSEWDIVLAADVLVYLGALEALIGEARRVLRPGGRLMLSIEELDTQDDYALRPTGRYAHAAGYLERLAAEHGFTVERIEPIPFDDLPPETQAMMEAGTASGMYTTIVPMQIVAYSSAAMTAMHRSYEATFRKGVLEPRLVELLRLHSAQTAMCAPCSTSRKDDSISEDDVACLIAPDAARFTPREFAAMQNWDLRHYWCDGLIPDHYALKGSEPRITGQTWICQGQRQEEWKCTLFLPGPVQPQDEINWGVLLPT